MIDLCVPKFLDSVLVKLLLEIAFQGVEFNVHHIWNHLTQYFCSKACAVVEIFSTMNDE